ncbi:lipopolysaccharide kinase InaA family protein [Oceanivirga salmonicida]|uniref:lipopolysaccharide kinase InaA family protein n=1 Tax=Oceanivirga salmonicida TaxID=1769291 RepID=UPI000830A14B|nr:lipopolysaccharide kinase InaA family protein [Oceanivirga salmonicida]
MNVIINNSYVIQTNKIIYEKEYIIKEYNCKNYKFIKKVFENEIEINKKLIQTKFDFFPKLFLIKKSNDIVRLYFKRINAICFYKINKAKQLFIFRKLLYIIRDLHSMGIIHNDINLSNILVDKDNKVYLIDYSLSSKLTEKNYINDIRALEYILKKILNNENIVFSEKSEENIAQFIIYWSEKYEPLFKK